MLTRVPAALPALSFSSAHHFFACAIKWVGLVFVPVVVLASDPPWGEAKRLYFSGDLPAALESFQRAIPEDASGEAALNASLILQTLGRYDEAIAVLRAAGSPEASVDRHIHSARAWAHLQKGDASEAARHFDAALQEERTPLDVLGMAWAKLEARRFSDAQALLEELTGKRPALSVAYRLLGDAHAGQGQRENARKAYEEALRKDAQAIETRLPLARLHEQDQRPDDAWTHYSRLTRVAPFHRAASAGVTRLAPSLTKKPDELVPPRRIARHTPVSASPERASQTRLAVGIGTTARGRPPALKSAAFRAGTPFAIVDVPSGKPLARGNAEEVWVVRLSTQATQGEIVDPDGKPAGRFATAVRIQIGSPGESTTILNSLSFAPGYAWGGMADKELRGEIVIRVNAASRSLQIINYVPLEEYLYGVLAAEMPSHWPPEALKAQAVISRTLVVYRKNRSKPHRAHGYDLCDEQHCQVYTGLPVENDKVRRAVDDTRGTILTYQGRAAHTVFHSNCGGYTQSGADVGWGEVPYWQAETDERHPGGGLPSPWELRRFLFDEPEVFCNCPPYIWSPEFRWTRLISAADLAEKLARKAPLGDIRAILPLKRSASGHIQTLRVTGARESVVLRREHEIRNLLGLGSLRSTKFFVHTLHRGGKPAAFLFIGGGWGHGVGLCQSGAAGRAAAGHGFEEILRHYYRGTALEKI